MTQTYFMYVEELIVRTFQSNCGKDDGEKGFADKGNLRDWNCPLDLPKAQFLSFSFFKSHAFSQFTIFQFEGCLVIKIKPLEKQLKA